jgi:hypothetical protein
VKALKGRNYGKSKTGLQCENEMEIKQLLYDVFDSLEKKILPHWKT